MKRFDRKFSDIDSRCTRMVLCDYLFLKKEIKMEQPVRRVLRLDPVDEKLAFLADKGVLLMGGEIEINVFYGFFMGILPSLYSQKKPLWIFLNSRGGDISQGLAIHDLLVAVTRQGVEVNIVGVGEVASMAVCIMQAATKRYSFPNTQFTVHQASISSSEGMEANQFREASKELDRVNEIVLKIISERSGMDLEKLKDLSNKTDYSINADNAKTFGPHGLIDEVTISFPCPIPTND